MTVIPSEHLALIKRVAYRLVARLPASVDVDDLIAYGVVGYLEAAPRWVPSRSSFETFIDFRVRGAMVDALRELDIAPRSVREQQKALGRAERALSARLGRAPSREELARECGISIERVDEVSQPYRVVSLNDTDNPDDASPIEQLADDSTGVDETDSLIDALRLAGRLDRAIHALSPREQGIIRAHFYEDRSELEIGNALGVTESRVSQLITKILNKLKHILEDLEHADALLAATRSGPIAPSGSSADDDLDTALASLIEELT